ncbi:hypothetical protein [Maribacter litopenaei]|uniref:hypothetical protein n=1 Tax=Maribacter litopenaei TaxID=2976127 RepID=UPI0030842A48
MKKYRENNRMLFDLKIIGATYNLMGDSYILDLGINQVEVDYENYNDFWYSSRIWDQGDLSTYYGYETLNAKDYEIVPAKIYPKVVRNLDEVKELDPKMLLSEGYGYLKVSDIPMKLLNSPIPLHLVGENFKATELRLQPGINPTFFLRKDGKYAYAVINGFLINLDSDDINIPNAMIFR